MEFLNPLLEEESGSMRTFLRQISSPLAEDGWIPNLSLPVEKSELGRNLSCLHTILSENISTMSSTKSARLRQLLDGINAILHRPSIPQLEEISRPTLKTLQQVTCNISLLIYFLPCITKPNLTYPELAFPNLAFKPNPP
jgi:hypothetical protein